MRGKNIVKQRTGRGVSIYMAILVMSILLAVAIGTAAILLNQIKMIRSMGDSVVALYAADTGIERVLYYNPDPEVVVSDNLDNNSTYSAKKVLPNGTTCIADYYCIKSIGTYKEVRRAIEVTR